MAGKEYDEYEELYLFYAEVDSMIHEQHAQPPATQFEQYEHILGEGPPAMDYFQQYQRMLAEVPAATQHFEQHQQMPGEVPAATQHFEQHQQMPGEVPATTQYFQQHQQMLGVEVPPATQFQQYHQMLSEVPPATQFQQNHQMLDEVPPATQLQFRQYEQTLGEAPRESAQHFQQFQQIPGEVPPETQYFQQFQQISGEVPPATQFQPYQQMLGDFAPSTMPVHHQQILAELSPTAMPSQHQQMLHAQDFPPSTMPVHHQQMLGDFPPATMPVHHQQTLADLSLAAAVPFQGQQMQAEPSQPMRPVQHQHMVEEPIPAVPLGHQQTLGESSWRTYANINNDDEELDIDAFVMGEGLASDSGGGNGKGMEENSSGAGDIPDYLPPAAEETAVFVPITPEQLHCGNCHVVREVRHVNGRLAHYFAVHRDVNDGRFLHAIVVRTYNGVHGQNNRQELLRLDLSRRTHAWGLRFIARSVETMRNEGGTVVVGTPGGADGASGEGGSSSSASASAAAATACTDDAEIDMLCELFAGSATAVNPEAAAPAVAPAATPETTSDTPISTWAPVIVESGGAAREVQATPASDAAAAADATLYPSSVNRRRHSERARDVSAKEEEEIRQFVRAAKEKAERDLGTPIPSAIKKICAKNIEYRNMANSIKGNNKKMVKLDGTAQRRSGRDLLRVRAHGERLLGENRKLYVALLNEVRRRQREDGGHGDGGGCAPPGKKDGRSGPSGGGGGGGGAGPAGGCAAVS